MTHARRAAIAHALRREAIQINQEAVRLLAADRSSVRARELLAAAIRKEDQAGALEAARAEAVAA